MSPHTRETRVFANEVKFVVSEEQGRGIRDWARRNLEADPHGMGPDGDEYRTTTIYFDTPEYDVFHRRGSHGRAKYRVRRYGEADVLFLERKLRKTDLLVKRRTLTKPDALPRLEQSERVQDWPGDWFHRRLLVRGLRPVGQVSYHRTARGLVTGDEAARLTLDTDLCATEVDSIRFADTPGRPVFEDRLILELKFRHRLPSLFKRLVEEFTLEPQVASKYRISMAALGRVDREAQAVQVRDGARSQPDSFHA